MPNWCNNQLTVSGATPELRAYLEENGFSFDKIHPVAEPAPDAEPMRVIQLQNDAWGTKWDLDEPDQLRVARELLDVGTAYFDTAWSPPIAALEKLSAMFPDDTFGLTYCEPGNNFAGNATFNEGTRYVLNGVLFTPDDGGTLVATDGRRLASAPAVVPPVPFILSNAAVHVLAHPDFTGQGAEITVSEAADDQKVAIRSGNHLLVSRTIAGNYPNYRQAIPHLVPELVTISGDRRPGVIAWLRALPDTRDAVRLSWEKRGQLTLTQTTESNGTAMLRVPVEIHGNPPVIAFSPRFLADALEIGSTLCLSDGLTPGVCRHPSGRFCLIMPCRVTGEVADAGGEKADQASTPAPAMAPALAA